MKDNPIDTLAKEASELDAELNALDESEQPEKQERKMRFLANDVSSLAPNAWVKRGEKREYGLEELSIGRLILHSRGEELPDELESRFQNLASKRREYTMTSEGAGTGAELVLTEAWPQLFADIHAATLVASLFQRIQMDSGKMTLHELGDSVFYKPSGEGQAVTATDLVTAKRTLQAYTLKSQVDVSDEMEEDSVVALLSSIRGTLVRNAAETIDSVILNADTTTDTANINKYGAAVNGDEDYLIGFDGLIHYAIVDVTGQKSSLTTLETADFATLIGLLGKYTDNPERCAFILDRGVKDKAIQLSDFTTRDKMGEKATLLTGQIGQVFGISTILSAQIAKSDANGRVDGATPGNNTVGRMILVNRDMWKVGFTRAVRIGTDRNESKGVTSLVCTFRMGLQCFGDRSDAKYCHTALGYNITV